MRTFLFADATSHKFWNITLEGISFTVQFGKVGTAGQTQVKTFPDEAKARTAHDKLVAEKLKKGYRETTPTAPASLRDALEAALIENPDDLATVMAYGDYLSEQGDPRGEFIQVQLALEDASRSPAERKMLQQREKELLKAHQKEWVGDWAELAPKTGHEGRGQLDFPTPTFGFERGILTTVTIGELTVECARAFVRAPQTRFVNRLYVGGFAFQEEFVPGPDIPENILDDHSQYVLLRWPHLANMRVFQLGWTSDEEYDTDCPFQCHLDGMHAYDFVKQMPRLEELYLFAHRVEADKLFALKMPHLRVLQLYHSNSYPLPKLSVNASLGKLTHLLCHPRALEYDAIAYIRHYDLSTVVNSPHLKSLTHLRLRLADLFDEDYEDPADDSEKIVDSDDDGDDTTYSEQGCKEIVESDILKRLQVLDLRHGRVSDAGAKILAECPDVKNLKMLDLSRNELTEVGIAALVALGIPVLTQHQHESTAGLIQDNGDRIECLYEGDYE